MSHITYKFSNAPDVTGTFQDRNFNRYIFEAGTKCKVFLHHLQEYRTGIFLGLYWHNNFKFNTYACVNFDDTGENWAFPCFDIKPI